jgi:hypothetical protein
MMMCIVLLGWVVAWYEYWEVEMSWQLASSLLRGSSSVRGVNNKNELRKWKKRTGLPAVQGTSTSCN